MIGILTIFLLVPALSVNLLVMDREARQKEAFSEVGSKWGSTQTVSGPILSIPFNIITNGATSVGYVNVLPDELDISGNIEPQMLKRGIYDIAVYNTKLKVKGEFSLSSLKQISTPLSGLDWNKVTLALGIPDMRGVKDEITLNWNNGEYALNPGISNISIINSGVSAKIPVEAKDYDKVYKFSFDIDLNGAQSINFMPVGKVTTVNLTSPWANPSFDGAFLPEQREVTKDGFNARWKVLDLNRNYPQSFVDPRINNFDSKFEADSRLVNFDNSVFGVKFLMAVDQYQKTSRSIKYAIMFIALTFLTFFFVEITNRRKIHPVQYLLVGFALLVFYTLLLSISEHINFNWAYVISSIATITLIVSYSKSIFKSNKLTAILGAVLVALYLFMFVVLQLQDFALLMGSIGLFAVLAIVMFISRKIDWYNFSVGTQNGDKNQT